MTLLEIAQAAEQKNRSAVQYHFGDRRGLIEAVLERHSLPVQASWVEPLALLEREGLMSIERLVSLIVSSLMRRALHADGGADYISICRQLLVHPTISLMDTRAVAADGAVQMTAALNALIDVPDKMMVLWPMRLANLLFHSIGDYLRFGGATEIDPDDFQRDLVETIAGWLATAARDG